MSDGLTREGPGFPQQNALNRPRSREPPMEGSNNGKPALLLPPTKYPSTLHPPYVPQAVFRMFLLTRCDHLHNDIQYHKSYASFT